MYLSSHEERQRPYFKFVIFLTVTCEFFLSEIFALLFIEGKAWEID
jgi:hypothetical protein